MNLRRGPRRTGDLNEEYAQESSAVRQDKTDRQDQEGSKSQKNSSETDTNNINDKDIMLLLERINAQLENMRLSEQKNQQQPNSQSSKTTAQDKPTDIESLVTQLLKEQAPKQQASEETSQAPTSNINNLLTELLQQTKGSNQMPQKQENTKKQEKPAKTNEDTLVLQTAAEVLSRAQYELSNELESSLKKLKQVISESEQIATKISNLIEQNNNNKA